jgi:hypothetical protein
MEDLGLWEPRLEQWKREVKKVLDYIHTKPNILGNDVTYDLNWVIICGHGFGGCTALAVCHEETIWAHYCIMLDPWLFCLYWEIIDNGFRIEKPLLSVSSSEYHENVPGFDSMDSLNQLFENCQGEEDRNLLMRETGHLF